MSLSEDDLCRLFAEKVRGSQSFAAWVIGQTKFEAYKLSARLLSDEQAAKRPHVAHDRWWRHWWRKLSETGEEGETDIFLVFEKPSKGRFAIHVENKRLVGDKFTKGQAAGAYERRAASMLNDPKYLLHDDYTTLLIAPAAFIEKNAEFAANFSTRIPYESISTFIPEFDLSGVLPRKEAALEGGCLCGALRYEANAAPGFMGYCCCDDCQKASGSGFIPFVGFAGGVLKSAAHMRCIRCITRTAARRSGSPVRNVKVLSLAVSREIRTATRFTPERSMTHRCSSRPWPS